MNRDKFSALFPLGSHLCREPMPTMSEMKRDMELLKRHGFNLVKLQENWAVDEPLEGLTDFSRYEELIDYAGRLDMGVYLGVTCEQAPNWLWEKYPDCRMVGRNGLPIAYQAQSTLPADGKPGPCWDHAGARADMVRFIQKLVRTLGRYENIVVWNTWQEIGYWGEVFLGQHICYCEHTLEHFRSWLMEKYGDLDGLNRAWNTRHGSLCSVLPDRLPVGSVCLPVDGDWRYFMDNVQIGSVLAARAQAVRESDPLRRPVFAHKGSPVIGSGADWTYARTQDFLGTSCYPAWGSGHKWDDVQQQERIGREDALLTEMWDSVALRFDYIRSCSRRGTPVWAAEFQGGPVSTGFHLGRTPSKDDIRRWMLTAVGSGVTAISFWVTRAEIAAGEMDGFGLLDSEGDTSLRLEEAGRVGRALNRHAELFTAPRVSTAKAAILIDERNYQLCMSLAQGGENLPYSVRGWHRLLWEAGIAVDFLEVSELGEEYIRGYRAVILPFPLSISEATAEKLRVYVYGGGNLISEACPGRLNEHGFATRGELSPILRELFGVRQRSLQLVREPDNGARWSPRERTWGEYREETMLEGTGAFRGFALRANVYVETFYLSPDSEPILLCGEETVGAVRGEGRGRAWLLGTYAGHGGTAYRDGQSHAFIRALMGACGAEQERTGMLLLRKMTGEEKEAWFFTNPGGAAVTERINLCGWSCAEDLFGEPLPIVNGFAELTVDGLDVRVVIVSR